MARKKHTLAQALKRRAVIAGEGLFSDVAAEAAVEKLSPAVVRHILQGKPVQAVPQAEVTIVASGDCDFEVLTRGQRVIGRTVLSKGDACTVLIDLHVAVAP